MEANTPASFAVASLAKTRSLPTKWSNIDGGLYLGRLIPY